MADEIVNVNPPFTQIYAEIIKLCGDAMAAASQDDVNTLHKINHELLGKSINLAQFSFFGCTIRRITQQVKSKESDPPDTHPV